MPNKNLFGESTMSIRTIEAIGKYLQLVEKFRSEHSFDPYVTQKIRREFERQYSMYYTGDGVELKFTTEVGDRKVYTRRFAVLNNKTADVKQLTGIVKKHKYTLP
jgi:hypothetical protein